MQTCKVEIDNGAGSSFTCSEPASSVVRVRDRVTSFTTEVPVCDEHKKEHDRKAATTRIRNK